MASILSSILVVLVSLCTLTRGFQNDQFSILPVDDPASSSTSPIRDILFGADIISEVLDDFTPSYYVSISYPTSHEFVQLGNDIPVSSVSSRPVFEFFPLESTTASDKNKTFTLILTDPDAKSRSKPKKSEMCHWILTNLTTPVYVPTKAKTGELVEYLPPSPPKKTGKHRYIFVLLEGKTTDLVAPKKRPHWGYGKMRHGVRDWAEENDLEVVGANFFYAANKKQ